MEELNLITVIGVFEGNNVAYFDSPSDRVLRSDDIPATHRLSRPRARSNGVPGGCSGTSSPRLQQDIPPSLYFDRQNAMSIYDHVVTTRGAAVSTISSHP